MKTTIKKSPKIVANEAGMPKSEKEGSPDLADVEKWTFKRILLALACTFFFPLIYWIGKSITGWLG